MELTLKDAPPADPAPASDSITSDGPARNDTAAAEPPAVAVAVTARELDVLTLIAHGQSNKEIARDLRMSLRTVERHITNAYTKIGARGRADAINYILRHRAETG
ncbi:MAG: response regulator transcription factor [Dehalococcoidia bacterium]